MAFQKGNNANPAGRPKGSKNKTAVQLKEAILASLEHRGGVEYINKLEDREFCQLLGKLLPKDMNVGLDGTITAIIERSFVKRDG